MELQVEACMKEEDEMAAATITQALSAGARSSLNDETFEMHMFMRGNKHHVTIFCEFFQIVN